MWTIELSIRHCDIINDTLIEFAADGERLTVVDGFTRFYRSSFDPNIFDVIPSKYYIARKGRVLIGNNGILHTYKLHGSMGWFSVDDNQIRVNPNCQGEDNWRRLIIPPQYRKATETTAPPYSALWARYRAWMVHGPMHLNRLVCIGYICKLQRLHQLGPKRFSCSMHNRTRWFLLDCRYRIRTLGGGWLRPTRFIVVT